MESALGWIGAVVEWFGRFIPRWEILDTTQGMIKYVKGKPVYCQPGNWYMWWPLTTEIVLYPVVTQVDRLETQVMESADGVTFMVGGTLRYSVDDLMKLVPTTYNAMSAIAETAGTVIHDVLCRMTWAEIKQEQQRGTLKTKLRNAAQNELREFGVTVERFKLNTLAKTRVFKISQSTASEEN